MYIIVASYWKCAVLIHRASGNRVKRVAILTRGNVFRTERARSEEISRERDPESRRVTWKERDGRRRGAAEKAWVAGCPLKVPKGQFPVKYTRTVPRWSAWVVSGREIDIKGDRVYGAKYRNILLRRCVLTKKNRRESDEGICTLLKFHSISKPEFQLTPSGQFCNEKEKWLKW